MRYIKVKCVNEMCRESRLPAQTIPAGKMVADNIMAREYDLECMSCGHGVSIERV